MKTTVLRQARFDKSTLLQVGGEGAVYAQNGMAVKVYKRPDTLRSEKLKSFLTLKLDRQLPGNVMAPCRLLFDDHDMVTAFEMPLLPPSAQPIKKLSQSLYCQQHAVDLGFELELLIRLARDLEVIHAANVIIGDLNDHNIYFDKGNASGATAPPSATQTFNHYWIDVDSFQFGGFPCPVALEDYLDPHLYGVTSFIRKPVFTRESDWYAFAVLLCKVLLKTHPYGGVHHKLKTVKARATAGVSVFHRNVTYPKSARPPLALNDALLSYLRSVFEQDRREPVPLEALQDLQSGLARCPSCGHAYCHERPHCPTCHRQSHSPSPVHIHVALQVHRLLETTETIMQLFVDPMGRLTAITHRQNRYRLLRLDGDRIIREMTLFSGKAGARFGLFQDTLVINPANRRDLMLVDTSASSPRLLQKLESERFDGDAVFATTPQALYRIAGGCVLRGELRQSSYLEDIIATAHRMRTHLWASPGNDYLAGFHRLFDQCEFFTIDEQGRQNVILPGGLSATSQRISAVDVAWGGQNVAFLWHAKSAGAFKHHLQVVDKRGTILHQAVNTAAPPFERLEGRLLNGLTLLHPTDQGVLKSQPDKQVLLHELSPFTTAAAVLHWHPQGLLIQDLHSLYLAESP